MNRRSRLQLDVVEPEKPRKAPAFWRDAARVSTVGLFVLALVVCLDLARPILVPIGSATVIGIMFGPLSRRAAAAGVPAWLFATLSMVLILALLQAITILVSGPIVDLAGKVPEFGTRIGEKLQALQAAHPALGAAQSLLQSPANLLKNVDVGSSLQAVVGFVTPALTQLVVFFVTLFFFLLERRELRRELVLVFREQEDRLRALRIVNAVEYRLTRYIGTVTLINLALGTITGFGAWLLGLPSPVLLGTLAFALNYLPYIGPAVVMLLLLALGIITFPTFAGALLPPALFLALATLEGQLITPNIVGLQFTLSPLGVFLSLSFWAWLWGPIGAFLSVPFLIIGLAVLDHLLFEPEGELPD